MNLEDLTRSSGEWLRGHGPESDIVSQLAGHAAQTLAEYLQRHPESYRHLLTAPL